MASDCGEPINVYSVTSFYRRHWLLLHLLCYVLISVSSLAMLFHFPILCTKFNNNCPLYAVPVVKERFNIYSFVQDDIQRGETKGTLWGKPKYCDFVFTMAALSFILAFIWCWFFCYCGAENKWNGSAFKRDQKSLVIPPAMIFALLMSILMLVNSCILSSGMHKFCSALERSVAKSCTEANNLHWSFFTDLKGFYETAAWSISEAWIAFGGWLMQTAMLFLHCLEGPGNGYTRSFENSTKRKYSSTPA